MAEELISEDNAADPKKISWMRSCRTDKGVHACGQVVSAKLLLRRDYDDLPDDADEKTVMARMARGLNEKLPEAIRIFDIKKTTGSFHAKERTDARLYEYLLPTYVLRPVDPEPYKQTPEAGQEGEPWDGQVSQISEEERAALSQWRAPAELLEQTRNLFKAYVGTRPFHNFTIGIQATEMKAMRHIIDVSVAEPFVSEDNGLEWVRVRFHGASFMLHQIRKMVGLVILAVRLGVGPSVIQYCLDKKVKVPVPRAPALGLLLDRALFDQYNDRNARSLDSNADHDPIDFTEYEAEREDLKNRLIYPKIYAEEKEQCQFWGWLKCTDDHACDFHFILNHPQPSSP